MARHIRKGDDIIITAGDYKGETGTVVRVLIDRDRVIVKGAGIEGYSKNLKPSRTNPQGGRVTLDRSFHMSNISPVVDGKASRVRFEIKKDGSKVRVAVMGNKELGQVSPAKKKK